MSETPTPSPTPPPPANVQHPQRKTILNLDAAFAVSLVLTTIPHGIIAIVALVFMIGVLVASYIIRAKAEPESLIQNHTTYIIRTIWIGSGLAAITTTIGGLIMMNDINYDPFSPCANNLAAQGVEFAANATYTQIWDLASPCFDIFIQANMQPLITAGIITIVPVLIYFAVRFVRGLSRAIKGYRIANPRVWF